MSPDDTCEKNGTKMGVFDYESVIRLIKLIDLANL